MSTFNYLSYDVELFLLLILLTFFPSEKPVVYYIGVLESRTNLKLFKHATENFNFQIRIIKNFLSFDGTFLRSQTLFKGW